MRHYHIFALAALISAGFMAPSQACSVVDDYRVPTNFELVEQAPAIILGRVVEEEASEESPWDGKLLVEPLEAIKGDIPKGRIEISGSGLVDTLDKRGFGILSNPYELEQAHPLSYIGGCIRYMFPKGTTVLFFIGIEEGKWRPAGGPFSRWAEDVLIEDAPWLRLTRLYTAAADLPEKERAEFFGQEMARLSELVDNPVAQLMAQDIARQLSGPNETWNATMQRMIGSGPESEAAADAIAELVMGATAEEAAVETEQIMANDGPVDALTEPE